MNNKKILTEAGIILDVTQLEIEIFPKWNTKGGQHTGSMPHGIHITHIPTGITASVNVENSQHKNLLIAQDMILAALTCPTYRKSYTKE